VIYKIDFEFLRNYIIFSAEKKRYIKYHFAKHKERISNVPENIFFGTFKWKFKNYKIGKKNTK